MGYLALDIGGTKIEVCRISQKLEIKLLERIVTSQFSIGRLEFLNDVIKIINSYVDSSDEAVCISFNCIVRGNIILASSLLGGENIDLEKIISEQISLPCVIKNDVLCQAMAENRLGYGKKYQDYVLVNIGTGLRVVCITSGKILFGFNHAAGEIEDLFTVEINRRKIERCLSGSGIANIYQALGGKLITAGEVFKNASLDDVAWKTINIFSQKMVDLLNLLSKFYNPQAIVLTGSVGKSTGILLPQVIIKYRLGCLSYFHIEEILVSKIEHAACLGAVLAYLG